MNLPEFTKVVKKLAQQKGTENQSQYVELFIRASRWGYVTVENYKPIKVKGLKKSNLPLFIEDLCQKHSEFSGYEKVCGGVYRIWVEVKCNSRRPIGFY